MQIASYRTNENTHTPYSYRAASFFLDEHVRTGPCTHGDGGKTSYTLQEPKTDEYVEITTYGASDGEYQEENVRGMIYEVSAIKL